MLGTQTWGPWPLTRGRELSLNRISYLEKNLFFPTQMYYQLKNRSLFKNMKISKGDTAFPEIPLQQ